MKSEVIRDITNERLDEWTEILVKDNSTPLILISVGHNHKAGQFSLCHPQNVTTDEVIIVLESILNLILK